METSKLRDILIEYTDSLRDYIRESSEDISLDERDSSEFVDTFLKREVSSG